MSELKDLTGKVFGKLTVIEKLKNILLELNVMSTPCQDSKE